MLTCDSATRGGFHQIARNRRQAGDLELVHLRRIIAGAQIHLLREFFRDDVDDEFARRGDVAQRVFARIGTRRAARP